MGLNSKFREAAKKRAGKVPGRESRTETQSQKVLGGHRWMETSDKSSERCLDFNFRKISLNYSLEAFSALNFKFRAQNGA